MHFVGNTMIDSLRRFEAARADARPWERSVRRGEYVLVTLHRPSNVDEATSCGAIVEALAGLAAARP